MKRFRDTLRNEYIGAIAIGFLLAQALGGIIGVIMQPILTYIQNRGRPSSIFAPARSIFNWPELLLGIISVVLHLLFAFLLYLWVYRRKQLPAAEVVEAGAAGPAKRAPATSDGPGEQS